MTTGVPVVDFSAFSLEKEEPDETKLQQLVDEIHHTFTIIGFVYLKNTGFPEQIIKKSFELSKKFFHLEKDVKLKYQRGKIIPNNNFGYVMTEQEGLNPERTNKDLKEAFNMAINVAYDGSPDDLKVREVPGMYEALEEMMNHGKRLHHRVLEMMARGLKLEDPLFFVRKHRLFGSAGSQTTLRSLHYPPISTMSVKGDQIRCGEHSDYGGITLLFQDRQAGLEVCNVKGEWIQAVPIEGTILVNIGDLMERWTADKLKASKHRVLLPKTDAERRTARQSIALFGHPDDEEIIECVDGSNKYPPIGSLEYLNMRFSLTY